MAEFALTDDDPDAAEHWVRIILWQMRLLDCIVDGDTLNERLFSLLDAAPLPVQREIIFCLPDILGDKQHHAAALKLSELLKTNFQLTAAIMEALDSLSLENALRAEVCQHMLQTLNRAPPEYLPVIVSFLISSDEPIENLVKVVAGLRQKLDLNPGDGLDGSNQVLILSALRSGALRSQKLADIWLKAIANSCSLSELGPLDVAILLVLYSFIPGPKKRIQYVLRNRIKAGVVTEALIEKTFSIFLAAINEYIGSAVGIATTLLKSPDPAVSYIGSVWFKLMLIHLKCYQSQSVILELLLLIGTGGISISGLALGVLAGVESRHLLQHTVLLMGLLDNLHDMNLIQVGQVMDLLCSLVYGDGIDSVHQDEIHMLIRKQLSSYNDILKQKGVVGAVMAIKHMATTESDAQEDILSSSSTDDNHLSERASRAKDLFDLVVERVQNSVTCVGLLYDQLAAAVCSCHTLDITFLKWIAEKTIDKFQNYYVKEFTEVSQEGCPQFFLDSLDDCEDAICVNIEGVLKKEKSQMGIRTLSDQSLCVMAPLFRLLRSLHFRIATNLDSVDGLLGCSVAMPKNITNLIDDFPELNCDEQIFILDSLFYCINWFREIVSAFSFLSDQEIQIKVLNRIENIISLQQLLAKGLHYAKSLNYKPPHCHFCADAEQPLQEKVRKPAAKKKAGKGKGARKGRKKCAGDTSVTDLNATGPDRPPCDVTGKVDLSAYKCYFRELDMEVFVSLSKTLVMDRKDVKEGEPVIYPSGLLFLLEDYVAKLDHCLPSTVKRISCLATCRQVASVTYVLYSNLDRIATPRIAHRAVKLLTYILKKLESTAEYCQALLDSNDGIYDGPEMFKEGSAEVKLCYSMLLQSIACTLDWSGFHSRSYTALLKDCLCVIASRQNKEVAKAKLIKELVMVSCEYFFQYASRTLYLTSAENLVRVMQALSNFLPAEAEPKRKLAEMCLGFLSRQWYTLDGLPERGTVYNHQIESLVKTYFTNVPDRLSVISTTAELVKNEVQTIQNKDSCLDKFPTIDKSNFPILYRNLWCALGNATGEALKSSVGNASKFEIWHSVCSTMSVLTGIIKQRDHRTNLHAYIQQSQVILKLFLSDGMPVLEALLKSKCADVISMLKVLQVTTRYLHALCISTKREKMARLTNYVPVVRRTLEALIFRVKGMLVANNSADAFWMGNLKNKTIKGEEILTQDMTSSEQYDNNEEEEEEEGLLEDDLNSQKDKDASDHESSMSEGF
ncbi:Fanconi anemia group D2 protein isoform X3 [Zootermopsis nevadensis]|uniref:Fanconi anemia group D2 protein n=2 Tax=Zootermopsis nevadensis TaxID=136037 RepID=A0A067QTB5_ZOONE|nr:Fanconi anemia group D2 protein isoform X3 [Zootermopsis nevadensis]XP_021933389.1 Fanconi anemia group D2 protein isoform X3 [Zootermopsis nevadensis]KDR12150.1 Fanconi anemia group D2 protein [Zootermopsis nevadensis]